MLKQFYALFYSFDIMQTRQLYNALLNYVVIMKFKKNCYLLLYFFPIIIVIIIIICKPAKYRLPF